MVPWLVNALPAIISGGASVLNGVIGSISQSSANDANIEASREAREWQSRENQLSRDFQLEMWNRQNAYNSPQHMMSLYSEAGVNPLLISGNTNVPSGAGAAGVPGMSGSPAVPHISPVNPAAGTPDAFSMILSALGNNMQVQSNQKLQSAQAIKTLVDSVTEAYDKFGAKGYRELMKTVSPILGQINLEGSRSDVLFCEQLKNNLSMRYNQDMDSLNKEITYDLGKKYGEAKIQANLEKLQYDISEIVGRLATMNIQNEALIKQTAADLVVKGAHAFMLSQEGNKFKADAKTVNQLRQYLVKTVKHDSEIKEIDSMFRSVDWLSSTDLVGFMTSSKGREQLSKERQITLEQRSSDIIRAIDFVLGDKISVTRSATPYQGPIINRTNNQIFPSTYSTNFYTVP